jgi:hypothetical protein
MHALWTSKKRSVTDINGERNANRSLFLTIPKETLKKVVITGVVVSVSSLDNGLPEGL